MLRALFLYVCLFGTSIYAQSVEERLPECIEEAEEILLTSIRIKDAIATEQRRVNPNDVMEVMFARDIIEMFRELIEQHIEAESTATELKNKYEKAVNPMGNKFDYIADMLSEHWENEGNFAKARYIAACANNFDGQAEAQADQIIDLKAEISALQQKITQDASKSALQKDKIVSLEKQISNLRENELKQRTDVITLQRELTELNKKNEQLEVNAQLANVYKEKFSKLLSKSGGATFVEELLSMSAFDRNVAMRDSKFGGPDVQRGGMLGGCVRRLRDQAQASLVCKSILAEFLESEAN